MQTQLPVTVTGHCVITDDLGNVLLNQMNSIHSINMARIISRGLSHEPNCWIDRIAFGNGGTYYLRKKDNTGKYINYIQYKKPNDGYNDDVGWRSRLYNETYSENIDKDVGYGEGAFLIDDISVNNDTSGCGCVSLDNDRVSQVVVTCKLNFYEPLGQYKNDYDNNLVPYDSSFVFDEIGLYTSGTPIEDTKGHQIVYIKDINLVTGVAGGYSFDISIDDGDYQTISILVKENQTFSDIAKTINDQLVGAKVIVNNGTSINTREAYSGFLFESNTFGGNSSVNIKKSDSNLFTALNGFISIDRPVSGQFSGYKNNTCDGSKERSRLLTHLVFSPILKSSNREFNIKYTLTVYVERTSSPPLIEVMNSRLIDDIVNITYDVVNDNLIKSDTITTRDIDISRIVHNLNIRGDVWSICGIALDGVYFENQYNYKRIIPGGCTLNNVKCTAIIEDKLYITLDVPNTINSFNKIDIYISGKPERDTKGTQYIKIRNTELSDTTELADNTDYTFDISIDNVISTVTVQDVSTYELLLQKLNDALKPLGASIRLKEILIIESNKIGDGSEIHIINDKLFNRLPEFYGIFDKIDGVTGADIHRPGTRNTPTLLYSINALVPSSTNKKLHISMSTNNDSNY
jgi:hypothetical protein